MQYVVLQVVNTVNQAEAVILLQENTHIATSTCEEVLSISRWFFPSLLH